MINQFLMGNEAIAMGALAAGVNVAAGYPGTPSTEVLETVAAENDGSIYVEWSVNEKAALELAAGAAMSGARSLVTMKQVGLNVASDPLMSLAYLGVKGGMVVMVADDPGPISSQTEQDTRTFAMYSRLPCFDPSSVQEAHQMMREAFAFSEKYHTPVLFRPTTRICHAYAGIRIPEKAEYEHHAPSGFERDPGKWVIFPKLSYAAHGAIDRRNAELTAVLSASQWNRVIPGFAGGKGIVSGGVSFSYVCDAAERVGNGMPPVLKIGTPFPFPDEAALDFLKDKEEILVLEELDPVIERALLRLCGQHHLNVRVLGKLSGTVPPAGENTCDSVSGQIRAFLGRETGDPDTTAEAAPPLPVRPPVLCAGCPHRASFYAVKEAMKGQKTVFCGDIGCYTLGNAQPLDMVDTCLCMGAGVNMAQGIRRVDPDRKCFAFVGDSTFFASALTGVVNALYNKADMTLVILDNSTTAMTGHQPHPGTGVRMMQMACHRRPASPVDFAARIDMEQVLLGLGVKTVVTADPLRLEEAIRTVRETAEKPGVKAIIFRSPCIALNKGRFPAAVDSGRCLQCRKCIRSLGCPGLILREGRVAIDPMQCTGCMLCAQVCPAGAIRKIKEDR